MIRQAAIRAMSRPDSAEYAWDPDRVCVILSDDAPLSAALEKRLVARGWRVAVYTHSAVPGGGLDVLAPPLGRVGALISIAPESTGLAAKSAGEALLGNAREEAWLLSQFRLARQLSPQLNALGAPRTWFVAVTRIDGQLGLGASPHASGVVAAGVYGLVKTLRLEWPSVFCRAIDLHPELDAPFAAERIVAELHDPDQTLGEVGHCLDGRSTVGVIEEHDA
ncbi:MAG: hypothetical protein Q8P41_13120 [Pseudomonadota bacterium]|nr:hypothetical protein [Pseudomonadota bacterium]